MNSNTKPHAHDVSVCSKLPVRTRRA